MKDLLYFISAMIVGAALTHHGIDFYEYFLVAINTLVIAANQAAQN